MTRPLRLTVFMDNDASLVQMDKTGTLEREMAVYRGLQDYGVETSVVTYGGRDELDFAGRMPGINILCNALGLRDRTYKRRIHQVHARPLLQSDLLKSHDSMGIWAARRASWAWQIPFIFRAGYMWSVSKSADPTADRGMVEEIIRLEREAIRDAARLLPTMRAIGQKMIDMAPQAASKLTVLPHSVNTDVFRPLPLKKRYDLVYVGRIASAKNLTAMLGAVEKAGVTIAMIGGPTVDTDGSGKNLEIEAELRRRFGRLDGRIHWLGRVKNHELPQFICQARAFILCSWAEGPPRAMIEAMACGLPSIGTNVFGINSTLQHGVTGYLCGLDADSIASAIRDMLAQPEELNRMGQNAREYARDNFSLPPLIQREYEILVDLARRNPVASAPKRIADYVFRRR